MVDRHFAQFATDRDYLRKIAAGTKSEKVIMDVHLDLLTEALAVFDLADIYNLVTKDSIDAGQVQKVVDLLFHKITTEEVFADKKQKIQKLWAHLAEDDGLEIEPADIIFVFGGPETTKAKKAAELYQAGKAPRIIFTGDTQRALVDTDHISESVRDAEIAMAAGVPREAIMIEKKSINTPENVQNALTLLQSVEPFPTSFILVNLPWYLRRATNTFLTYWRNSTVPVSRIHRVNAGSDLYNEETYFQHRRVLEYVVFEYLKIKMARDMGHM